MKIETTKAVAIVYELTVDGKIADKCTAERPLEYIHGTGTLLKRFEDHLEGLEPGSSFAFTLTPAEGYGEYDPDRVVDLPKSAFIIEGQFRSDLIRVGNIIPLMTSEGAVLRGTITAVKENAVTVDVNNPMAGKTLNFTGAVLSVRDATPEELSGHGCGNCHGGKCRDKGENCGCGDNGNGCGCDNQNCGCDRSRN